tara:strand:- start:21717 stop:22019 length:303 start_codon:yes stop_codon:yes gene_type:complete
MKLTRENLLLTQTRASRYRFSYEPMDELTPSAEGIIEVDSDTITEGNNLDSPMFSDTTLNGIEFVKIQIWDCEGFQDITETDLGQLFRNELEILILNELL